MDDIDHIYEPQDPELAKVTAVVRRVLEGAAAEWGMRHDRMCILTMFALRSTARDASPKTRRVLTEVGTTIDAKDAGRA